MNVGDRPILLKNSISIVDEKFLSVTGRDARVWLGQSFARRLES